ncbi:MAG: phosphoribosylglycinamide formyltransferase [Acidimicrobiia bacterium]|nr:phosphoribosylglycinamide formyltransferase [Acidimicrobiia bacterium]MXZ79468.1 phosphoribosylglycinamide formyltransferase [Acidimicrobiia bacterium]MXZ85196.1 phosphoribosylglycinamide formyltransferase [Acidimicrobiia bacterium]MYB09382.1 phosphoribosylglycinamide formyltransferase [Acidimicrobiia bacterium]MYB72624.1 phosphoribosylglycinamide formyltransferase [Acidimicrobiia bacterium]
MRLAVLASGSGTILDVMARSGLPISLVLVDRSCKAEKVAADHGLACELVERTSFGPEFDRVDYTRQVTERLQAAQIELVAMAGFGTVLDQPIQDAYGGRILNTHPSLLPAFPGWHAVQDAMDYGVKVTGCTVHVATLEVDAGPILAQQAVAVEAGDTVDTLHERIKTVERDLYIRTVQEIIDRGYVL